MKNPNMPIYISGENGYNTYRIPALVNTSEGTLLAFCEGRKNTSSDAGDIDIVLRRSTDSGITWSEQEVIWDDSTNTCGNPCPIVDTKTGEIHLLLTWNRGDDKESEIINGGSNDTRRIFYCSSNDDGISWSIPKEITTSVKEENWTWYATGPGAGIQIERGENEGRLIAPCDHIEKDSKKYFSHIIYSDDHGKSWSLGGTSPNDQVNECQVAEISENRLILNMRNYDRNNKMRQITISNDGGQSWIDQQFDEELIEPICQASLVAGPWSSSGTRTFLAFSNPADSINRMSMTIKFSKDEGKTWPAAKLLYGGPSAYSDLALLNNNYIACLYESGVDSPYERIEFGTYYIGDLK